MLLTKQKFKIESYKFIFHLLLYKLKILFFHFYEAIENFNNFNLKLCFFKTLLKLLSKLTFFHFLKYMNVHIVNFYILQTVQSKFYKLQNLWLIICSKKLNLCSKMFCTFWKMYRTLYTMFLVTNCTKFFQKFTKCTIQFVKCKSLQYVQDII